MARATSAETDLFSARIALGVFFLFEGCDKLPWVTNPDQLSAILNRWSEGSSSISKRYLEHIALPGAPLFARLVFFGEVFAGLALIFGFCTRATAMLSFLMVVNIHLAHNTLLHYSFLAKGDGLPVLGGLLALAIGGKHLPLSLTKRK